MNIEARVDVRDVSVKAERLQIDLRRVHHVSLRAGSAYLAYGVDGRYGSFTSAMPAVRVTSSSKVHVRVGKRFLDGIGARPLFEETMHLDSPGDKNPYGDHGGWRQLIGHAMKNDFAEGKVSLCPQIGVFDFPCYGLSQRPHTYQYFAGGVVFNGRPDDPTADTINVFTMLDPGNSSAVTQASDILVSLVSSPYADKLTCWTPLTDVNFLCTPKETAP